MGMETDTYKVGATASANPFRFSAKYTDGETGLLYYGAGFRFQINSNEFPIGSWQYYGWSPIHQSHQDLSRVECKIRVWWNKSQNLIGRHPRAYTSINQSASFLSRCAAGSSEIASRTSLACGVQAVIKQRNPSNRRFIGVCRSRTTFATNSASRSSKYPNAVMIASLCREFTLRLFATSSWRALATLLYAAKACDPIFSKARAATVEWYSFVEHASCVRTFK